MIIFDIGASTGVYCNKWIRGPKRTIYAFEPNPVSFKKIKNHPNLKKLQKAVSDVEGERVFYEANYRNSSSLLPFTENTKKWKNADPNNVLATINTFTVDCIRLDNFIETNSITETIDFIKIDTQGNDLKVIKSLGDYIYNVKEISCEVQIVDFELYKDATKKSELLEYMKEKDFSIWKVQKWSHNQEENIWFTNNKFKQFLHLQ